MKIEFAIRKAPVPVIDPKQVREYQGLCRSNKKGPYFRAPLHIEVKVYSFQQLTIMSLPSSLWPLQYLL